MKPALRSPRSSLQSCRRYPSRSFVHSGAVRGTSDALCFIRADGDKRAASARAARLSQVLLEELERARPRELRGGLVVPGRGVVVESVLRARVLVDLIAHLVRLQRGLVVGPRGVDAVV